MLYNVEIKYRETDSGKMGWFYTTVHATNVLQAELVAKMELGLSKTIEEIKAEKAGRPNIVSY